MVEMGADELVHLIVAQRELIAVAPPVELADPGGFLLAWGHAPDAKARHQPAYALRAIVLLEHGLAETAGGAGARSGGVTGY